MKILVAPDKFKGSLTALDAAGAIVSGIKEFFPKAEIVSMPLADGGGGTVDAIISAVNGEKVACEVLDPLGRKIKTYFGIISQSNSTGKKRKAIIEMAKASGFLLLKADERNPMKTTSYGTGELIKEALLMGCKEIIVGIGDTATVDGGMGALQALGVNFLDKKGDELGLGGKELIRMKEIKVDSLIEEAKKAKFVIASDVENILFGEKGAAYVFGPQKGASPEEVEILDRGLRNLAKVILEETGKDISGIKGTGAAGGIGAGFKAFLDTEIRSGI
ncbi:MAG: glycerate kinase, partial [Actinomycetia bacterium]|nr:glycerate kinase [Actinomycetes bacterium]